MNSCLQKWYLDLLFGGLVFKSFIVWSGFKSFVHGLGFKSFVHGLGCKSFVLGVVLDHLLWCNVSIFCLLSGL